MNIFFYYFGYFCFGLILLGIFAFLNIIISNSYSTYKQAKSKDTEKYWRKKVASEIRYLVSSRFTVWTSEREKYIGLPNDMGIFLHILSDMISSERHYFNSDGEEGCTLQEFYKAMKGIDDYAIEDVIPYLKKVIKKYKPGITDEKLDSYLINIRKN